MGKGAGCRAHSGVRGVEQSCGTAPPRGCVVWNDSCHPEGLLGPPQRSGTATTQGSASDLRHGSHELLGGHPTSQCAASWEGGCKDTRSPWKPLGALRARRSPGEVSPWALCSPASPAGAGTPPAYGAGAENQEPEHRSREDQRQHFWGVCGLHPLEEAWGQRQAARQQPAAWCTAVLAWPGAAEAS